MIWKDWLNKAILHLYSIDSARCDAELILKKVTGKSRSHLLAFDTTCLNDTQIHQANILLKRRIQGEPIAYLIGMREFWSLNFKISSDVFIPRPDTECLVEYVLLNFPPCFPLKVLDLGTGSGAIALSIASERPNWKIIGVDFSSKIINLAHENANLLKIKNVRFFTSDWFHNLKGNSNYDLIVSNPPYIDADDPHLLCGDVRFEPKTSLISKNKGLADLFYICQNSYKYLKLGGYLILEHGFLQGEMVREFFVNYGFKYVTTIYDYSKNERVTYGMLN